MANKNELQLIHKGAIEAKKRLLLAHETTLTVMEDVISKDPESDLEKRLTNILAACEQGLSWLDAIIDSTKL